MVVVLGDVLQHVKKGGEYVRGGNVRIPLHLSLDRKGVFIATQLKSTSSCRHVHSVNNCHLSVNVVTQLTRFVGHDVINKKHN